MATKIRQWLIALPWVSLPLLLCSYLLLWDKLPAVLAVQFDFSGKTGNSMRKEAVLAVEAAVLLFVLLKYSLRLLKVERGDSRIEVLIYYIAVSFVSIVFQVVLRFNI